MIENTINKLQKNVTIDNINYLHELNEKILYSKKQLIIQQKFFPSYKEFKESPLGQTMLINLKVEITKFNNILKKLSIKQKLEMPEIKLQEHQMKKKIDLLNKLTRQNITSQDDQEFKKKMMKIMVQKEKFKIDRVPSQSSVESYEFPDSPRRNPVLNYAANKGVVFQEKKRV